MVDFKKYDEMVINETKNTWWSNIVKNKGLDFCGGTNGYLVAINKHNAEIIENGIKEDESYNDNFLKKIYEYYRYLNNGVVPKTGKEAYKVIFDLIRMIDLENSTNQWRYKKNRDNLKRMVDYIIKEDGDFWERLKKGDSKLVNDLRLYAVEGKADINGPKSLASKVCKYFNELFFEGHNDYYINDSVVRHALPYYLEYYGINKKQNSKTYFENLEYEDLHEYMDELLRKVSLNGDIKRSELDHILWYCYRFENSSEMKDK